LIDQNIIKYSVISLKRHKPIAFESGASIEFIAVKKRMMFGYINRDNAYIVSPASNYLSFAIKNLFRDFSRYNIIHNLFYNSPIILKNNMLALTTVHDVREIIFDKKYKTDINGLIRKRVVKFVGNQNMKSDYLLVPSTQTRSELIKLGFCNKIFITPYGINENFISIPIKHKSHTKSLTVGYLGSFEPNKNVEFLIKLANKIDNNYIRFDMWGTGSEYGRLKNESKNKNVQFKGFAPEDKK
jgi:glycosyltransferase involved in cell wall biosynthesis